MITLEQIHFSSAIKNLDTNKAIVGWTNNLFTSLDLASGKELVFTESELQTEIDRLEAEYTAQAYSRARAVAYPSLADQADMQYHDSLNSTTTWKDAIAKVKSDNPKPE